MSNLHEPCDAAQLVANLRPPTPEECRNCVTPLTCCIEGCEVKIQASVSNMCGPGHCSAMLTKKKIQDCRDAEYDDWNGLCPYQKGNRVTSEQVAAGIVALYCCDDGCEMKVHYYAQWNGLCAYT